MKVIATNKRINFEYFVLDRFEAGISLIGCEVKSIRAGNVSLNDSFVLLRDGEAYINNMYVKTYSATGSFIPNERRMRKLLLHKSEIKQLLTAVTQKGLTVVPVKLYFDRNFVKLEIAICRGKKLHDKRETIKAREVKRNVERELKSARFN